MESAVLKFSRQRGASMSTLSKPDLTHRSSLFRLKNQNRLCLGNVASYVPADPIHTTALTIAWAQGAALVNHTGLEYANSDTQHIRVLLVGKDKCPLYHLSLL
jgi:hypothetical protein